MHSQWDADSEVALAWLGADVSVFVGDFGEEAVQVRRRRCRDRRVRGAAAGGVASHPDPTHAPPAASLSPLARQLVEQVAALALPKAVVLGNHDGAGGLLPLCPSALRCSRADWEELAACCPPLPATRHLPSACGPLHRPLPPPRSLVLAHAQRAAPLRPRHDAALQPGGDAAGGLE